MKSSILTFFLSLFLGLDLAHGAVIMVSPGQSVQAAVDGASSGDEIIIQGGVFNENVTVITKALHFRSFSTISEIHSLSFFNSPGQSTIQNLQLSDLNATNSDLLVKRATIGNNVNIDGGKFQILQSTITEKLTCKASVSHILYNDIRYAEIEGNSTITGNHFNGRSLRGVGIDLNGTATRAVIRNNRIHSFFTAQVSHLSNSCLGIWVQNGASAAILNNLIYDCKETDHRGNNSRVGIGILVESSSGTKIIGNALWNCSCTNSTIGNRAIWAPASGVIVENNLFWNSNKVGGGVVDRNSVEGEPKFTDKNNGDFTLASDSPCINAGPPDPQYNDRDGSRNDIGMFGGHNFIPDGRTTHKPIVLGLDVAPIAVPVGGTVTIESTGATVK